MKDSLYEIITKVLKIGKEDLLQVMEEKTAWDSLQRVEILFVIEDEFDVTFDSEELKSLDTPKKLMDAVMDKAE